MIKEFTCRETKSIWEGIVSRKPPCDIQLIAKRKLLMLDSSKVLNDLKIPPGNRLEALKGNRKGQHSIRINNQWRVCFVWVEGNAYDVQIVDYH